MTLSAHVPSSRHEQSYPRWNRTQRLPPVIIIFGRLVSVSVLRWLLIDRSRMSLNNLLQIYCTFWFGGRRRLARPKGQFAYIKFNSRRRNLISAATAQEETVSRRRKGIQQQHGIVNEGKPFINYSIIKRCYRFFPTCSYRCGATAVGEFISDDRYTGVVVPKQLGLYCIVLYWYDLWI